MTVNATCQSLHDSSLLQPGATVFYAVEGVRVGGAMALKYQSRIHNGDHTTDLKLFHNFFFIHDRFDSKLPILIVLREMVSASKYSRPFLDIFTCETFRFNTLPFSYGIFGYLKSY
jgi:hypothetical protein